MPGTCLCHVKCKCTQCSLASSCSPSFPLRFVMQVLLGTVLAVAGLLLTAKSFVHDNFLAQHIGEA